MNYTLGKKIRLLRKKLGLTQNEVACDILSRSILSKIETDKVTPSIYQLKYIATILNVSIDFLLSEDEFNKSEFITNKANLIYKYYNQQLYVNIISMYESNKLNCSEDINSYYYIGVSYFKLEFSEESNKVLRKYLKKILSLDIDSQFQYADKFIKSINMLASNCFNSNKTKSSIRYTLIGKRFLEDKNLMDTDDYLKIVNNLGLFYISLFDYRNCISVTERFINMPKEHLNLKYISGIYLNLNISCYNIGEYDNAIKYIKIAMFFYKYMNNDYEYEQCYINYINCYRYSNNLHQAFEIFETFKNKYFNNNIHDDFLVLEAILYFNVEDFHKVIEILSCINTKKLNLYNSNSVNFIKGHIEFLNHNYEKAKYLLNRCKSYLKQEHYFYDLALVYKDLFIIEKDYTYMKELKDLITREDIHKNVLISPINL